MAGISLINEGIEQKQAVEVGDTESTFRKKLSDTEFIFRVAGINPSTDTRIVCVTYQWVFVCRNLIGV